MDSSSLASAGYDGASRTLEVEFRNGNVYRYFGVPGRVWRSLLEADSAGRFLNLRIKGTYPYAKVPRRRAASAARSM